MQSYGTSESDIYIMKSVFQKPSSIGDGSGLVLFDEYLNDEDFLEFLTEWSDSIGNKDHSHSSIPSYARSDAPLKRKVDQLSISQQASLNSNSNSELGPFADCDAELVKLPIGIFDAFNTGDLQHVRDLIKIGMTPDCLFKTMMIDKPLVGRHVYAEFWTKLSVSHPDMVFILKKVRLSSRIGEPRCIKFNFFFTGTNTFPGATETYYYNNDDYLTKNLDSSKYSEKEKNAVNLLVAQHRAHGTPYVAFGRGSGCYTLNEYNKVNSISFEWKLTSICPPMGEVT